MPPARRLKPPGGSVAVNVLWMQKLWPLLRQSAPLVTRLAEMYVRRGADRETAESLAGTAVLLDQVLEERLRDLARREDVEALRQEVRALGANQKRLQPRLGMLLLLGELAIVVLLFLILWTHA